MGTCGPGHTRPWNAAEPILMGPHLLSNVLKGKNQGKILLSKKHVKSEARFFFKLQQVLCLIQYILGLEHSTLLMRSVILIITRLKIRLKMLLKKTKNI